jgi:hypothetical protein
VELGVIKPTGDSLSIRRAINYFLENLAAQTQRQETIAVGWWEGGSLGWGVGCLGVSRGIF